MTRVITVEIICDCCGREIDPKKQPNHVTRYERLSVDEQRRYDFCNSECELEYLQLQQRRGKEDTGKPKKK